MMVLIAKLPSFPAVNLLMVAGSDMARMLEVTPVTRVELNTT